MTSWEIIKVIYALGSKNSHTTPHGDPSNRGKGVACVQHRKTCILTKSTRWACVFTACFECEGLKPICKQTTPASASLSLSLWLSLMLSHPLLKLDTLTTSIPCLAHWIKHGLKAAMFHISVFSKLTVSCLCDSVYFLEALGQNVGNSDFFKWIIQWNSPRSDDSE